MKMINGHKVHLTASNYLYVDGKKVSEEKFSPLHKPFDDSCDNNIIDYVNNIINRRWKMVNSI